MIPTRGESPIYDQLADEHGHDPLDLVVTTIYAYQDQTTPLRELVTR